MVVGFIGVGRMGSALVEGFVGKGVVEIDDVLAFDVDKEKVEALDVKAASSALEAVSSSDVVFLCVKPQTMDSLLKEIGGACSGRLLVSIAAGISTSFIEGRAQGARVVRVMPNTPALVGVLAAGYCLGRDASAEDGELAEKLLSSLGVAVEVEEELMDAVTGLSGSGPAYFYFIIDALAKAAEKEGLPEDVALQLSAQTAKGAAEMILEGELSPQELIERVKSPGGTTEQGMNVLEESGLSEVLEDVVEAAAKRSRELGR